MNNNGETVFHSSNGGINPNNANNDASSNNNISYNYLSPWSYFGYQLLFSIPIVGFIFLIIYSFDNDNINRKNFARSYWCRLLIVLIIVTIIIILTLILGVSVLGNIINYIRAY